MTTLRRGFTTGTAAAAAAKAAALGLRRGYIPEKVSVPLLTQETWDIPIHAAWLVPPQWARASVIKDAGDDPDVTNGVEVIVTLHLLPQGEIRFQAGEGVGVVTKPGLALPPGEPAINPGPRRMIKQVLREVFPQQGFEVEISIPGGEELALKTFNPRLGVVGGLSILGTTGIVEPKSLHALKETIRYEIEVAIHELGNSPLCLAPGKIGEEALQQLLGPVKVVQMSNFLGFALGYARKKGVERVVVGGHPGKLAKVLMGYWDTHSRHAPPATDKVARFLGLEKGFQTVEEILQYVSQKAPHLRAKLDALAEAIALEIKKRFGFVEVRVILFNMKLKLLGEGQA